MFKKLYQALLNRVTRIELKEGKDVFVLVVNPRSWWSTLSINNQVVAQGYTNMMGRRLRQLKDKGILT